MADYFKVYVGLFRGTFWFSWLQIKNFLIIMTVLILLILIDLTIIIHKQADSSRKLGWRKKKFSF